MLVNSFKAHLFYGLELPRWYLILSFYVSHQKLKNRDNTLQTDIKNFENSWVQFMTDIWTISDLCDTKYLTYKVCVML